MKATSVNIAARKEIFAKHEWAYLVNGPLLFVISASIFVTVRPSPLRAASNNSWPLPMAHLIYISTHKNNTKLHHIIFYTRLHYTLLLHWSRRHVYFNLTWVRSSGRQENRYSALVSRHWHNSRNRSNVAAFRPNFHF